VKHAHCPESPTGAHWWVLSWPEDGEYKGEYIGTCKFCGKVRVEDKNLGMDGAKTCMSTGSHVHIGKRSEFRLRASGRFYAED